MGFECMYKNQNPTRGGGGDDAPTRFFVDLYTKQQLSHLYVPKGGGVLIAALTPHRLTVVVYGITHRQHNIGVDRNLAIWVQMHIYSRTNQTPTGGGGGGGLAALTPHPSIPTIDD